MEKPKSGSSGSPKKFSTWPYFEQLSFIRQTLGNRKRPCSLQPSEVLQGDEGLALNESSVAVSNNSILYGEPSSSKRTENWEEQNTGNDTLVTNNESDVPDNGCASVHRKKPKSRKRGPADDLRQLYIENEKKKLALLEKAAEEDDDMQFFHSLMPDIKSLPRPEKLVLRMDMQRLVYNAVLKNYKAHQPTSGYTSTYSASSSIRSSTEAETVSQEDSNIYFNLAHVINNMHSNDETIQN